MENEVLLKYSGPDLIRLLYSTGKEDSPGMSSAIDLMFTGLQHDFGRAGESQSTKVSSSGDRVGAQRHGSHFKGCIMERQLVI